MSMSDKDNDNFFDKFGLEVSHGDVEVGGVYPIYGMITKFISDIPGEVIVELNFNIEAKLHVSELDKINLIKERSFEPGIFVSTVVQKDPTIKVDCTTVVFGKRQDKLEQ